jgi:glycosyltransferase involved in cell wall biosynthesis
MESRQHDPVPTPELRQAIDRMHPALGDRQANLQDNFRRTDLPVSGKAARDSSPTNGSSAVTLSLVVPAYNEEGNVAALCGEIAKALPDDLRWELVYVDDGSTDRTEALLREEAEKNDRVKGIVLRENRGQTTATWIGLQVARGQLICTLDADLQNDPRDIPKLLEALGDHDAVVGYRAHRRDTFVRRASSRIANAIRNRVSGDSIRDTGCSLKLFRSDAIRSIPFFDGMHRFLPTLLRYHNYSVVEVPVSHRPRIAGTSKYGIRNRALRAAKDLLAVRWMRSRILKPVSWTVVEPSETARR